MSLPERHQHPTAAASPLSSSRQSVRGTTTPAHPAHPAEEDSRHQYQLHQDQNHQVDDTASQRYETGPFPSEPQATAQPRHSQFQPFFTLVEDANTGESHHPTVHYIFSDDDTDILTEAAVRSLEQEQQEIDNQAGAATRRAGKKDQRQEHHRDTQDKPREEDSYHEENENDSILPPPIPGVRDNYIILDVEPTVLDPLQQQKQDADPNHPGAAGGGAKSVSSSPATQPTSLAPPQQQQQQQQQQPSPRFTVTTAHSLTPAWQVLNTELVPAPTFENNASSNDQQDQTQPQPLNGGLMLKIHGTPGHPPNILTKDKDNERGNQRLEDMMDQFAKRMSELQRVIEAGDIPAGPGFDAASASRTGLDGEDQEQGHLNLLQEEDTGDEPAS